MIAMIESKKNIEFYDILCSPGTKGGKKLTVYTTPFDRLCSTPTYPVYNHPHHWPHP